MSISPAGSSPYYGARLDPSLRDAIIRDVERHPVLVKGDRGPAVVDLQTRLRAMLPGTSIDDPPGTFGASTEAAVRAFQTRLNSPEINQGSPFEITGEVRAQTWGALLGLAGPDKLEAGSDIAGRHADEYRAPTSQVAPPTQEQIDNYHNVFQALADMSPGDEDLVTPEVARQVADDLLAGRSPRVPEEALAQLGLRMVEATRGDAPDSRIVFPSSTMSNREFDGMMYSLLGATLAQHDPATHALISRLDEPNEMDAVSNAVAAGIYR